MTYSVKNSSGTVTYTVADGAANTNAISLTFLGKGETNYGTYLNQNLLWLLENFSNNSSSPPAFPIQGQLWWDSTYKFLNVYNGSTWNTVYGNIGNIVANGTITSAGAATVGNLITSSGIYWSNGTAFATSVYSNANVASYLPTYTGTFGTLSGLTSGGNITATTANVYATNVIANTAFYGPIATNSQPYITSVGTLTTLTTTGNVGIGSGSGTSISRLQVTRAYGKANGVGLWVDVGDNSGTIIDNPGLIINDTSGGGQGGASILFRQTNGVSPRRFAGIWGITNASGSGGILQFGTSTSDSDTTGPNAKVTLDSSGNFYATADRKSTRLNSSHIPLSRMPSSA